MRSSRVSLKSLLRSLKNLLIKTVRRNSKSKELLKASQMVPLT